MNETEVAQRLRVVAARLTGDVELRKDLMQEMHLHLMKAQASDPGKPFEWYVKGCEFHARNYLKLGRSIDSLKRARQAVPWERANVDEDPLAMGEKIADTGRPDLRLELMTSEILELVTKQLTARQQQTLELLMKGCGVRETARRLGVSHPAIIKHRRKIARLTATLLDGDSPPSGSAVPTQRYTSVVPVRLPSRVTMYGEQSLK